MFFCLLPRQCRLSRLDTLQRAAHQRQQYCRVTLRSALYLKGMYLIDDRLLWVFVPNQHEPDVFGDGQVKCLGLCFNGLKGSLWQSNANLSFPPRSRHRNPQYPISYHVAHVVAIDLAMWYHESKINDTIFMVDRKPCYVRSHG